MIENPRTLDNGVTTFEHIDNEFFSDAACKGLPTGWWFPSVGMSIKHTPSLKTAKEICKTCKVRRSCYEYGIATNSWGIWGGVSLNNGYPTSRGHKRISDVEDAYNAA